MENKIIVHAIIKHKNKYLVTKRSKNENVYKEYWDIPGGLANQGETPREALIREVKEEVNLKIKPVKIIHEDSNLDKEKNMIFIRLVYLTIVEDDFNNIKLDLLEHTEYKLITNIKELKEEKIVPFLKEILTNN
mgnify:FL=1